MTKLAELNPEEKKFYHRHLILKDFGEEAQQKLKAARVLVVGAGGLGCPVLQYLTAAGVGTIGIVDGDRVSLSNLHRQILFGVKDVGMPKAKVAAEKLEDLNPFVELNVYEEFLSETNALDLFGQYDLIVDGSDNFSTRYLVNDACVLTQKPFVAAAIFRYEGQLSVFNWQGGPTYRCLFPEPPQGGAVPNCAEAGVLGVLPGVLGTLQANEVIKALVGLEGVLSGKFLTLDLKTLTQRIFKFPLNPKSLEIKTLQKREQEVCEMGLQSIEPEDALEKINDAQWKFLDVRTEEEWEFGVIPGAILKPLDELLALEELPVDWDLSLCVYCKTELRAMKAVEHLKALGHKRLWVLAGGVVSASAFDKFTLEIY